jgi:hypothetical protein
MSKPLLLLTAIVCAAALTACASKREQSISEAAREACQAQQLPEGAQMDACIIQMEETIRAARVYKREPEHPHRGQQS